MKLKIVLIALILIITNQGFCQEIRTFNTVNFSSTLSNNVNTYSVSVGEMVQINRTLPFRFLVAAQYSGKFTKSGVWHGKNSLDIKKNLFTSNINLPMGAEVYYKNIGLGLVQEIVNFNIVRSFDSTQIKTSQNYEIKTNAFSHVFSNKNNLNSTFYLVYTISDSFSLKAGLNRGNEVFNFYEDSKKIGFSKITDNSIFISIRTNIEK
jgi:hypothetical protein